MKTKIFQKVFLAISFMVVLSLSPVLAQATKNVTFQVSLVEWYDLYLDKNSLTFTDQAPDAYSANPGTKIINANEGPLSVRVFAIVVPTATVKLTVTANGNLTSGSYTIPASALSWSGSGNGYASSGTLQANTAVEAGSWSGSILTYSEGTMSFSFLRNYTNQAPGVYTMTATFTLSKV